VVVPAFRSPDSYREPPTDRTATIAWYVVHTPQSSVSSHTRRLLTEIDQAEPASAIQREPDILVGWPRHIV